MSAAIAQSRANNPTRRTSGPASSVNAAATPSSTSSGRLVAERNSPHTLRRGNGTRSTSATDQPARASSSAVVDPAGPPPITTASKECVTRDSTQKAQRVPNDEPRKHERHENGKTHRAPWLDSKRSL